MKTASFIQFEYKLLQSLNLCANMSNHLSHIPSAQEIRPKEEALQKIHSEDENGTMVGPVVS